MKIFNRIKKFMAVIVAVCCAIPVVGCGGSTPDDEFSVQFYYWSSGYGDEWIEEIVNNFNEQNGTYTVYLEPESSMNTVEASLHGGAASNTYDLYMTGLSSWSGFADIMEPLDDVLSATYGNESQTIAEKFTSSQLNPRKDENGSISSLFYGNSVMGIFYNHDIFEEFDYSVPRTTNELANLVDAIRDDYDEETNDVSPFVVFQDTNNGYFKFVYEVWAAQYWGESYYTNNFLYLKDANGTKDARTVYEGKTVSGEENKQNDGRYKSLEVLEQILTNTSVHKLSTSFTYTESQTAFLEGQAAMTVSGTWMKAENDADRTRDIRIMKTPVISSIVERLDDTSITDEQLSLIVKAIDENKSLEATRVSSGVSTLSQNDFDYIKNARGMVYDNNANNHVFIPNYSNAKNGAKEFLKYFYSDEASLVWMNDKHEPAPVKLDDPSKHDKSSYDNWDNSVAKFSENITFRLVNTLKNSKVFSMSGKDMFANVSIIDNLVIEFGRKNSDQIWSDMLNIINSNWNLWINA